MMMNNKMIKVTAASLLLFSLLNLTIAATAESRIHRSEQGQKDPLHGKYKDTYRKKPIKRVNIVKHRIKDVDLVTNDPHVAKNTLLRKYIKKILNSKRDDKTVERYIWLINEIPGYEVDYNFRNAGGRDVDLVLNVKRTRVKLSTDASNHGVKDIGRYQFAGTAQLLNPFGWNDLIGVSIGTSDKPESLFSVTGFYTKKLNSSWGTEVNLLYSYIQDEPVRPAKENTSKFFRAGITQPIIVNNKNGLDIGIYADYRDIEDFTPAGKSLDYYYTTGSIFVNGRHKDFLEGENALELKYTNIIDSASINLVQAPEVSRFDRNFGHFNIDFHREQPLSKIFKNKFFAGISIVSNISAQVSGDDLPVEAQFFVGGNNTGKGYRTGLISSNEGFVGYQEIRYDYDLNNKFVKKIQPYGFYEGAYISKARSSISRKDFYSVGGGVRVGLMYDIFADVEVAEPLSHKVIVDGVEKNNTTKVNFLVYKELSF